MADDLRAGLFDLPWIRRLKLALALAQCIDLLEAASCSHRDLSASNVFVAPGERIYIIDWDCLYHPDLPFQANTTLGTMGYIAPFLNATDSGDPARSWRPGADRFALAILVAEILLVGPDTPAVHEDGTLFGQAQIDEPGNRWVQETIDRLMDMSRLCGSLLLRASSSATFEGCPTPGDWIAALRHAMKRARNDRSPSRQTGRQRHFVDVRCTECQVAFSMAKAKCDELGRRHRAILCKKCLNNHFARSAIARAQRKAALPEISCDFCQETFSRPRKQLDDLRRRGRPILCPSCLGLQLERWRAEQATYERNHPRTVCARCKGRFRLRRQKLDELTAKGKAVLCRTCLKTENNAEPGMTARPAQRNQSGTGPWHFIRRILYGHCI